MKDRAGSAPIAIAGAGIAGLSAAIALSLEGFAVRVFERKTELQAIGAGIQLGPNAARHLTRWEVPFADWVCKPESLDLRKASTGKLLNAIPFGETAAQRYGAPYVTLLRADLQNALLSRATALGCELGFDSPVSAVTATKGRLEVKVGDNFVEAAALIGADGLWSAVREWVPAVPEPAYSHITAWRSLLAGDKIPEAFRRSVTLLMAPGAHLVLYPVSSGSFFNAVLAIEEDWRTIPLAEADAEAIRTGLLRRLEGWAAEPRAIVSAGDWQPWSLYSLPKSKAKGGEGLVQLIGDAWHAMPPFLASGGAMAIEDAAWLAQSFSKSRKAKADFSAETALALFRMKRAARVSRVASRSVLMGRVYHFPEPFDLIRDLALRMVPSQTLLAANDWLYGHQF